MDIIEAEQFFKQYCGLEFHMGREEPKKYNSYRKLNTSDDMKEKWRQELIREKLKALRTLCCKTSPDTWCVHSSLIEIIMNTKTAHEENILQMLDIMGAFTDLDLKQKTLIIENIGERGYNLISIALKYESCGKRLEAVMDKIIASCHTDNENDEQCERYQNAVYNYQAILKGLKDKRSKVFFVEKNDKRTAFIKKL